MIGKYLNNSLKNRKNRQKIFKKCRKITEIQTWHRLIISNFSNNFSDFFSQKLENVKTFWFELMVVTLVAFDRSFSARCGCLTTCPRRLNLNRLPLLLVYVALWVSLQPWQPENSLRFPPHPTQVDWWRPLKQTSAVWALISKPNDATTWFIGPLIT